MQFSRKVSVEPGERSVWSLDRSECGARGGVSVKPGEGWVWSLGRGECGAWKGVSVEPGRDHFGAWGEAFNRFNRQIWQSIQTFSSLQQILLLPGDPLITNTPRVSQCRDFVSPEGLCETPEVHWARMAEATHPRAPYMSYLRLISTVSAASKARKWRIHTPLVHPQQRKCTDLGSLLVRTRDRAVMKAVIQKLKQQINKHPKHWFLPNWKKIWKMTSRLLRVLSIQLVLYHKKAHPTVSCELGFVLFHLSR